MEYKRGVSQRVLLLLLSLDNNWLISLNEVNFSIELPCVQFYFYTYLPLLF